MNIISTLLSIDVYAMCVAECTVGNLAHLAGVPCACGGKTLIIIIKTLTIILIWHELLYNLLHYGLLTICLPTAYHKSRQECVAIWWNGVWTCHAVGKHIVRSLTLKEHTNIISCQR